MALQNKGVRKTEKSDRTPITEDNRGREKTLKLLNTIILIISILLVAIFSIYIRLRDVKFWEENKSVFFYNGTPIYSEYDSFYFARIAKDMINGNFKIGKPDPLRFYPDNILKTQLNETKIYPEYGISGNGPSIFVYIINRLTKASFESITWHGVYILTTLTVIPLFIYGLLTKSPWGGILGALTAVSSPIFLARTNLMRLDHDMLNLFFPFSISLLSLLVVYNEKNKRFIYSILLSITTLLYYLWYAHSNIIIVQLVFLFIGDTLINGKINRDRIISWVIILLPQLWYLYEAPLQLYKQVMTLVIGINLKTNVDKFFSDFPNVFLSISELQKLEVMAILKSLYLNSLFSAIGLIGFFVYIITKWKKALYLIPIFIMGLLSFRSGARFIMYLAPFAGFGLGYLVEFAMEKLITGEKKIIIAKSITGFIALILSIMVQWDVNEYVISTPKASANTVRDMEWIKNNTPQNSVIWTWWDYGYAFNLYSERANVHDGGSQTSPKTYFVARSFSVDNPEKGWLITSFITNYGLNKIIELINNGVKGEEIVSRVEKGEFKAPIKVPTYWVFTADLIPKFGWINYFGTYDFKTKTGNSGKIILPEKCYNVNDKSIFCEDIGVEFDTENKVLRTRSQEIPVRRIIIKTGNKANEIPVRDVGIDVEVVDTPKGTRALVLVLDPSQTDSLFNKMFILRNYDPRFFELVLDDFPVMVVYRVKDRY